MLIGSYVRRLREGRGLEVSELASASGAAEQSIRELEADERSPRLDTLAKVARGLQIPLRSLLPPTDEREPWEQVALRLDLTYAEALELRSALDSEAAAPTADREHALATWLRVHYGLPDDPRLPRSRLRSSRRP